MSHSITSFRAYAFLAVFLFHCSDITFSAGYLGVQAFFVLSGFLLTPILLEMKRSLPSGEFFLNFYGRRFLRIFPLYYFYLASVTLVCIFLTAQGYQSGSVENFLSAIGWSYTYTYNFYHATDWFGHSKLVTHFWSLAVEEQFYLIWPIVIFFAREQSIKQVLLFVILLGIVSRILIEFVVNTGALPFLYDRTDIVIYVLPFSHIDAFAIGGLFALYGRSFPEKYSWIALTATIGLGLATEYVSTGGVAKSGLGFPPFMSGKYIFGYCLINLFFAFMLVQVKHDKFLSFMFNNKIAFYLGTISYGLYVFHYPILWAVPKIMPDHDIQFANDLAALALSLAVAAISYHFFESKFTSLKGKYFPVRSDGVDKHAFPGLPVHN